MSGGVDERARRRFEKDRRDGGDAALASFLPPPSDPRHDPTLVELLCIEREFLWKRLASTRDAPEPLESWLRAHPAVPGDALEELRAEERALRARYGVGSATVGLTPPADSRSAPAPVRLRRGVRLGRYELESLLGEGGFAAVWKAWDPELVRHVAVKVAHGARPEDSELLARVRREARSVAKLAHPAIVPIHEVGEEHGVPFLVSRLLTGPDLARHLEKTGPLPVDAAARWAARLARAVHYAHECGVVHRDIKPANVLLDEDGRPLLTDFGLARLDDAGASVTREGDLLGTPAYMAPEQARGATEDVGARSDVYALGVLLYEMVCGARPFEGDSAAAVLHAVLYEAPVAVKRRRRDVPRDLVTVIETAMASEPERRYASAERLAADLDRFLERRPVEARRRGPVGRLWLWARRNPALAASVLAGLVLTSVVAAVGVVRVLDENERFRRERDRANELLYRSLSSEVDALLTAKRSGWRQRALENLARAAALPSAAHDPVALRTLAARALTEPGPSLIERFRWTLDDDLRALEAAGDGAHAFTVTTGGRVRRHRLADGHATHEFGRDRGLCVAPLDDRRVLVGTSEGLEVWSLASPPARVRRIAIGAVRSLAVSPAASRVAVGLTTAEAHALAVLPLDVVAEGTPTPTLEPEVLKRHRSAVNAVAFTADGSHVASASQEGTIAVARVADGASVAVHTVVDAPRALRGEGNRFVIATYESFSGVALDGPRFDRVRRLPKLHDDGVTGLRLTPSGAVTCGADGHVRCFDPAFARTGSLDLSVPLTHVALADDGSLALVGARREVFGVAIRDVRGLDVFRTDHTATFIPGTETLATPRSLRRYAGGKLQGIRRVSAPVVEALAFDPLEGIGVAARSDGSLLVLGAAGVEGDPVTVASESLRSVVLPEGEGVAVVLTESGEASRVRIPPTGDSVRLLARDVVDVVAEDGVVFLLDVRGVLRWDGGDVERIVSHDEPASAIAAGDGCVAVVHATRVAVRDGMRGQLVKNLPIPAVTAVAFLGNGAALAVVAEGTLRWFATDTWEAREWNVGEGPVTWIAADPAARFVAVGAKGRHGATVHASESGVPIAGAVWSGTTDAAFVRGRLVVADTLGNVELVAISDLRRAATRSRTAREADLAAPPPTLRTTAVVEGHHGSSAWAVAASPGGDFLATGGHFDGAKLWDLRTGRLLWTRRDHRGPTWCAAFGGGHVLTAAGEVVVRGLNGESIARTPDGDPVLVAGIACAPDRALAVFARLDGRITAWRFPDGDPGVFHRAADAARQVAFSADGHSVAVAAGREGVLLFPIERVLGGLAKGAVVAPALRVAPRAGPLEAVAFSPDGRLLAVAGLDGDVTLLDAGTHSVLVGLEADLATVRSLSFSASGRLLTAACYGPRSATFDLVSLHRDLAELGLGDPRLPRGTGDRRRRFSAGVPSRR